MVIWGFTNRIMSKMAYPASASPPGEIYVDLDGFLGLFLQQDQRPDDPFSQGLVDLPRHQEWVRDLSILVKSIPSSPPRGPFSCSGLSCMFILSITIRKIASLDNAPFGQAPTAPTFRGQPSRAQAKKGRGSFAPATRQSFRPPIGTGGRGAGSLPENKQEYTGRPGYVNEKPAVEPFGGRIPATSGNARYSVTPARGRTSFRRPPADLPACARSAKPPQMPTC